jgi:PadR family transcriptional regulator PadR
MTRMGTAFFDNWTVQLRKGILELCILAAVGGRSLYGYDIVRALREVEGLGISEGTVYPILSRFKREGLVSTALVESKEGPARKYYRLTPRGRQLLAQMRNGWQTVQQAVNTLTREPQP